MNILFLQFLIGVIFLTLVFLHLTKKNFPAVVSFGLQSFAVAMIFLIYFLETRNIFIFLMVILTLIIKVILAPLFFTRFIKKHKLSFSESTYLNMPLTLIVIVVLTFLAHSGKFLPLTNIIFENHVILSLALSAIFISLFLIINRKGALSQILAILSLENSIVAFIIFAGLEKSPGLQIGVIFNIFVWIIIATVFMSMIYKHFESHDVTAMNELKD